jgi:hypothetical protein
MKKITSLLTVLLIIFATFSVVVFSQTTEFTYQGSLRDGANPANGNYDMQFLLYDSLSPTFGNQIGTTLTRSAVAVTNGIFGVQLDFGDQFPGAARYLEIRVRQTGGASFTELTPRQSVSNIPYAVKSLSADSSANALQLGGVAANQYVTTATGGANFILNSASPQATSNFNISGNGTVGGTVSANTVSTATISSPGSTLSIPGSISDFLVINRQTTMLGAFFANSGVSTHSVDPASFQTTTLSLGTFNATKINIGGNGTTGNVAADTIGFHGNSTVFGALTAFGINAVTQYNLGSNRMLSAGGIANLYVGYQSGAANPTGSNNAFIGAFAGVQNSTGGDNTLVGFSAGGNNSAGSYNSFFGSGAGSAGTSGTDNSFFGVSSGRSTTGGQNSFFGRDAGYNNGAGIQNSAFGNSAGYGNTTGNFNTYFGFSSGLSNTTESGNSFFGYSSDGSAGITNSAAIGFRAKVSQSNSLVLGSINGVNSATADTKVGIGTTAPLRLLQVKGTGSDGAGQTDLRVTGSGVIAAGITIESTGLSGRTYSILSTADNIAGGGTGPGRFAVFDVTGGGYRMVIDATGNLGIGNITPQDKLDVNGIVRVGTLGSAGATTLCRNASNQISTCSSSMRYKKDVYRFSSGLSLIKQLRPVSFNWRDGGMLDMGLVAEEVNKVEPLLTTTNDKGEIEGVKYDRVGVVLVNAVQEQQEQIEKLEDQNQLQQKLIGQQNAVNRRQQAEIDALKALVCSHNRKAAVCRR